MEGLTKIILYLIPLIVLILLGLFYFGPSGALDKLKDGTEGLKSYLPDVSMGAEQLTATQANVPKDHQTALNELKQKLQQLTTATGPCFEYYTTISGLPDLQEQGTSLTFSYNSPTDETIVTTYGGAGGKQIITDLSFTLPKTKLCVVAGPKDSSTATSTFSDRYLNTLPWQEKIKKDLSKSYTEIHNLKIVYHPCTLLKSANHIEVPELGIGIESNECNNLQDYGIIYKPDSFHICFLPTVYGASDKDGLNNDYLGENSFGETSIPKQLSEGKLKKCITETSPPAANPTSDIPPTFDLPGDIS